MTSPPPLLYDTYYHIFNRGVNKENIFIEERNYAYFLQLLQKYIEPVAEVFAYCLLRNHFHLLIRTGLEQTVVNPAEFKTPSRQFSNFFNAYAKAINQAYNRMGSLFQHPYGRVPISDERYFYRVVRYIHHNPQKHGLIEDFRQWKYSSYGIILRDEPTVLQRRALLEWFGKPEQFIEFHQEFEPLMDEED